MLQKEIKIINPKGIHARPSSLLVATSSKLKSSVTIIKGEKEVNGKSIMGILSLGAVCGDIIMIRTDGEDEEKALKEIESVFMMIYEN